MSIFSPEDNYLDRRYIAARDFLERPHDTSRLWSRLKDAVFRIRYRKWIKMVEEWDGNGSRSKLRNSEKAWDKT